MSDVESFKAGQESFYTILFDPELEGLDTTVWKIADGEIQEYSVQTADWESERAILPPSGDAE